MRFACALLLISLVAGGPATAGAQSYLIVVSGLSGEPKYQRAFDRWATAIIDAANGGYGLPGSNIVYLAETVDINPARIDDRSTKLNVEGVLADLSERTGPDATIFILLIGHGGSRASEPRFSLPGPDMTAADLARALDAFPTQKVVLVNAASASGEFIPPLSATNRVIVTATKSGFEQNETMFGGFFVEAFAGEGADVDKDGRVSVLEAFNYARREVARTFEKENRLLTEHALLDDNGDGVGSAEPDPLKGGEGDGALAARIFLVGGREAVATAGAVTDDPELAALYKEKQAIEGRIAALRVQKEGMDPVLYEQELEALLIELALTARAIREIEGNSR